MPHRKDGPAERLPDSGEEWYSVLVVDDDETLLRVLERILREAGHRVLAAGDAEQAWSVFQAERPDLALLDVVLPGRSGPDLAQAMREADPDLAILFMTGEPELETARRAVQVRAYDYLLKPVEKDLLLLRVSKAIRERRLLLDCRAQSRELARRYQEMAALDEARDALTRTVLDDLAAPLHDAANILEIYLTLHAGDRPGEEVDLLHSVRGRLQTVRGVVGRLADLYLLSRGDRMLAPAPCAVAELLADAAASLAEGRLELDPAGVAFEDRVQCDGRLMVSALAALLEDLVEHGDGRVRASLVQVPGPAGRSRLRLEASGTPPSTDDLDAVADPLAGVVSRTGIAIPFARTVLEAHGGRLESDASSSGRRCFLLELPSAGAGDAGGDGEDEL